jgi:DNA-binding transcriptional MerR regulator
VPPRLPLPAYDGSVGLLPASDVDTAFLLERYGITKPTLFKRRDALVENGWVNPSKLANRVYYSPSDVHVMDNVHYWSKGGYNLTEIVAHLRQQDRAYKQGELGTDDDNAFEPLPQDPIDVKADNATTDLVVRGLQTSAKDLQLLGDEFVEKFAKRVGEVVKQALPHDPLKGHDFLSKAADKGYQVTGKMVAEALGYKPASLSRWEKRTEKFGFIVVRIGAGLYKIEHGAGVTGAEEAA